MHRVAPRADDWWATPMLLTMSAIRTSLDSEANGGMFPICFGYKDGVLDARATPYLMCEAATCRSACCSSNSRRIHFFKRANALLVI